MAGPLTTSLRGLWVSGLLPPDNGGKNGRAATLEPTKRQRGRLGPRAGIPKRKRPNCHSCPKGTLEPAWVLHQGEGTQGPGVEAPLHLAQSLGRARVKARGVVGRIGGMLRYAGWLLAQGVGRMLCAAYDDRCQCRSSTIVNCKLETGQNDVALEYITSSVEDRS